MADLKLEEYCMRQDGNPTLYLIRVIKDGKDPLNGQVAEVEAIHQVGPNRVYSRPNITGKPAEDYVTAYTKSLVFPEEKPVRAEDLTLEKDMEYMHQQASNPRDEKAKWQESERDLVDRLRIPDLVARDAFEPGMKASQLFREHKLVPNSGCR